jgi:hypothetical protein
VEAGNMSKAKGKEPEAEHNFQIRPPFSQKFKPGAVKVQAYYLRNVHTNFQNYVEGTVA